MRHSCDAGVNLPPAAFAAGRRARLPRSAAVDIGSKQSWPTTVAFLIRRSSARRSPQRALRLGVLPQNGAGQDQWSAAALGQISVSQKRVGHRLVGQGQRAEV
jgi:hypothetical protein